MPATVERLEYDPNRTAFIALIKYEDGLLSYIIAPQRLAVGDTVISSAKADIKPGNTLPLKNIPVGTIIHNIELKPKKGAQMVRSAGTYAQLVGRDGGYAQNMNQNLGKAGRKRHKGKRPSVRGVVMNPFDHPHGGGEGKSSGGRHPVTPWGKKTRGPKTRKNKSTDRLIIRRRNAKR